MKENVYPPKENDVAQFTYFLGNKAQCLISVMYFCI